MPIKIVRSADCGNSPKNLLVQALVIAIETSNRAAFTRCVSDEVTWAVPGRRSFAGRAAALAFLTARRADKPHKLIVLRALSHGHSGAGDGIVLLASGLTRNFCHVVDFTNARGSRIANISSYYSDLGDSS